jgi:small subunit ribosomal protein S17
MPQAKSDQAGQRKLRKIRQGVVVSDKMNQSIVVRVDRTVRHRLYKKVLRRSKRYMAHDQENTCRVGDVVRIMECRPISRNKRWRLMEVVSKAEGLLPSEKVEAVAP